jgi:hypothetical protein
MHDRASIDMFKPLRFFSLFEGNVLLNPDTLGKTYEDIKTIIRIQTNLLKNKSFTVGSLHRFITNIVMLNIIGLLLYQFYNRKTNKNKKYSENISEYPIL